MSDPTFRQPIRTCPRCRIAWASAWVVVVKGTPDKNLATKMVDEAIAEAVQTRLLLSL
jgi:hypothetical protein